MKRLVARHPEGLFGLLVLLVVAVLAIGAPLVGAYDPLHQSLATRLLPPGGLDAQHHLHWLGTDPLGRDVWSRIVYGARVSLTVALVSVVVSGVLGTVVGLVAGFYRGLVGTVLMRCVDIVQSIPFLLLAVAVAAVLGPSFLNMILVLGLTRWPRYARVAYGQTLSARDADFVKASEALGATDFRLLFRHVLPAIIPAMVVVATLEIGTMIIFEASLSFLGLGIQPPTPSWGGMLYEGRNFLSTAWWQTTFPGVAIILTVMGANLVGDLVRDRMDPRNSQSISI